MDVGQGRGVFFSLFTLEIGVKLLVDTHWIWV